MAQTDEKIVIAKAGRRYLELVTHGARAGLLPLLHRDPFDQLLNAQAPADGLAISLA